MSDFQHGLIVGKFYPPHLGHLGLISDAAERCARVSVVVAGRVDETISLEDRVRWVAWESAKWTHVSVVGAVDEHRIDCDDPAVWDLHEEVFRTAIDEIASGVRVDVVFSGEDYGEELARRFHAIPIGKDRGLDGRSGTRMRRDIRAFWSDLMPAARIDLARRVVVVGAESTGTTTLADALADQLGAGFVGEYGRAWSAAKLAGARQGASQTGNATPWLDALAWTSTEFTVIAQTQTAAIDMACLATPIVVADTDALATSIWQERYVGRRNEAARALANVHPPDLYILTSPDGVPFDQDGLRDGEQHRTAMHETFIRELDTSRVPWTLATGTEHNRLKQAAQACQPLLRNSVLLGHAV